MAEEGSITTQIASQLRGVYFGGNWTWVNLKEHLSNVSWHEATMQVGDCNTILSMVFHLQYYTDAILNVLMGNPLKAKDKDSWVPPTISSESDWEKLLEEMWQNAEKTAILIEELPESTLWERFDDGQYGNYYRNLHGVIEHAHYHLGQIVLIKKLLLKGGD